MLPHDEQGAGPAVVLLHAGIADRSMWDELRPRLAAQGYRVVAIDLPGFGEAAPGAGPQAPWNEVLATLDDLGIQEAALVGCSYGGAVALRVAALHRGRFWALVLVSTPAPGLEPSLELAERWATEERALDAGDLTAATDAVVAAWTRPDAPAALRDRVAAMQRNAFELQAGAPPSTDAPDPLNGDPDRLTAIQVPTLVVTGAEDLVDFREGGRLLARLLPDAELVELPGAAHLLPLEQPEALEHLVAGALGARVPAG
ncbi:MAG: alpha/beta hydrolase [Solirubrobacteraceae bacterium]|nr:alpha/beta hydrolase [Solirubrobacteraceae bacterium]